MGKASGGGWSISSIGVFGGIRGGGEFPVASVRPLLTLSKSTYFHLALISLGLLSVFPTIEKYSPLKKKKKNHRPDFQTFRPILLRFITKVFICLFLFSFFKYYY